MRKTCISCQLKFKDLFDSGYCSLFFDQRFAAAITAILEFEQLMFSAGQMPISRIKKSSDEGDVKSDHEKRNVLVTLKRPLTWQE